jgi:5-formaminoimidazole-4-carboxamide-1-(beta)-D-ribofuranosyl 5'-monophosphate synthetase
MAIDKSKLLQGYDLGNIRIATLGGHSALDVCRGAKTEGFETIVIAQKGRDKTFTKHYQTRGDKGCVDHVILVDDFSDVAKPEIQKQLRELNAVFVHSRYFWVYCDIHEIENDFNVPIIGNRVLVRKEERDEDKNQYFLLKEAGINIPRQFKDPRDIDCQVIVKAAEAARSYERAFFLVNSYEEYLAESKKRLDEGVIDQSSLDNAIIEEFVLGPQLNLNFFYSPVSGELELLGTDTRRQTNIDGLLRQTANEQTEVLKHVRPQYIENGHVAVTIKESLVEKAYECGEKFVEAVAKHYPPGMIGPFALQGAITPGPPAEKLFVFDVSMRIPGSPGTMFTPYSNYMYGENLSVGRRLAMEVKQAISKDKLESIIT